MHRCLLITQRCMMGEKIGYARVSTVEQNLDMQQRALKAEGCSRIFTDRISGGAVIKPGLEDALRYLRAGDTLCIWRLDRLSRSLCRFAFKRENAAVSAKFGV